MSNQIWNKNSISTLFEYPLLELLHIAASVHAKNFDINEMELCTLLSIKTGACPEDCAYCPQSGHYNTYVEKEKLIDLEIIMEKAKEAKKIGGKRFCMGAAWRNPPEKDFPKIVEIIKQVKALGLETCMTLGMLTAPQAQQLKEAGLDFYNHNLDTSENFYKEIISTRTYADRLQTLDHVGEAGIGVCCGGILGMGESREDRIDFINTIANLKHPPLSVPMNRLVPIKGTPLEHAKPIENFEFIKTIAILRIVLPKTRIRFAAGRTELSDEMQTLCFMAGVNSIFYGDTLLTSANVSENADVTLLKKLGMKSSTPLEMESC